MKQNSRSKAIFLISLLLISAFQIVFPIPVIRAATDIYVSTTGSDTTGTGTIGNPYATLWKAVNESVSGAGDTIWMRGGTYTPGKQTIIQNKVGDSTHWLTIRNYTGETVTYRGDNCPTGYYTNASIEIKDSDYVRVTGINIEHSKLGGFTIGTTGSTDHCHYIRFDNGSIKNSSSFGFKSQTDCTYIYLENSTIYNNHCNWSGVSLSQEAISFSWTSNFEIKDNLILNNRAEVIDLKYNTNTGSVHHNTFNLTAGFVQKAGKTYYGGMGVYLDARGTVHNITIHDNLFYGNNSAINLGTETAGHVENITIYNNLINITNLTGKKSLDGRYGIAITNEWGSYTQVNKDIDIYSNTIFMNQNNIYNPIKTFTAIRRNNLARLNIYNNILIQNNRTTGTDPYRSYYSVYFPRINFTDGIITLSNNLYYNYYGGSTLRIGWYDGDATTSTPAKWGSNPLFVNPQITSYGLNPNFHLLYPSPCLDNGTATLASSIDYDHVSRPQGLDYDIGAYEFFIGDGVIIYPGVTFCECDYLEKWGVNQPVGFQSIECYEDYPRINGIDFFISATSSVVYMNFSAITSTDIGSTVEGEQIFSLTARTASEVSYTLSGLKAFNDYTLWNNSGNVSLSTNFEGTLEWHWTAPASMATYTFKLWDESGYTPDATAPTDLSFTIEDDGDLRLNWDRDPLTSKTVVVRNLTGDPNYPINTTDGTVIYNGTAETVIDSGAEFGNKYYYTLWGYTSTLSADNITGWITHIPEGPQDLDYNLSAYSINISWTIGKGADRTLILIKNESFSENETDGTVIYNDTGTWNVSELFDEGYFTLFSYNSTNHTYSIPADLEFGLFGIYVYNESNPSQGLIFDLFITNVNGTQTYIAYDCTNPKYIGFGVIPTGPKTVIKVSSDGYKDRYYYIDLLPGTVNNLIAYLPPVHIPGDPNGTEECTLRQYIDSETITNPSVDLLIDLTYDLESIVDVQIYNISLYETYGGWMFVPSDKYVVNTTNVTIDSSVLDDNTTIAKVTYWFLDCTTTDTEPALFLITVYDYYDQPVADVKVEFKAYINTTDSYESVSILYTDSMGQVSLYLIPFSVYKVVCSKDHYITSVSDYSPDPSIRTHTFKLIYEAESGEPLESIFDNLSWTLSPKTRYQEGSFLVTFTINSTDSQLQWYRMRVDYYNKTLLVWETIYSGNASNPGGGSLSYTIPNVTGKYRVLTFFKKIGYDEYEIGYTMGGCDIFTIIFGGGLSDNEVISGIPGWVWLLVLIIVAAFAMAFALPFAGVATGYIGIGIIGFGLVLKPDLMMDDGTTGWIIFAIIVLVYSLGLFIWSRL